MSAAARLRAASDTFYRLGREFDAIFAREMADSADRLGEDALYANWAGQMEARALRFTPAPRQLEPVGEALQSFNMGSK